MPVQLVHPAEQGKYALYFEPDLQQVKVADSDGNSSLCDSLGLGSELREGILLFILVLESMLVHLKRSMSAQ